jgi:Fe-S-cluster containining protein
MNNNDYKIIAAVADVYRWIAEQTGENSCHACGKCCDFEAYGHRLYVSTPEIIYLESRIGRENMPPMQSSACPWRRQDKCTIHQHRFAGCRIFFCKGDPQKQSEISEEAIKRLKKICDDFSLTYRYAQLQIHLPG